MQYSIKTLMAITLAVAVACAMLFVFPHDLNRWLMTVIWSLIAPAVVIIVIYGEQRHRCFAIGFATTLFCLVSGFFGYPSSLSRQPPLAMIFNLLLSLVGGWVAVRVWRRFGKQRSDPSSAAER